MPPVKPITANINGITVELFYTERLATALGRTTQTIRKWEIGGTIPKAIFKDKNGRRMYSQDQIDVIVRVAEDCGLKQGSGISSAKFRNTLVRELKAVNQKYLSKGVSK